jgi:large subunit ribosomal protein L6
MSRIGRLPIPLPKGVDVTLGDTVTVKGPKGQLSRVIVGGVSVAESDRVIVVTRQSDHRSHRAAHGLMRALINNMVIGVTKGYTKNLEIRGVGYKAEVKGSELVMNLGYSHPIHHAIPAGIKIDVAKGNKITVAGIDKETVGQQAAVIRGYRSPDSYKGKGVRYLNEVVRLKAGKAGKA